MIGNSGKTRGAFFPFSASSLPRMLILAQCRTNLMIGKPGKSCGAFFPFSASSLQRMRGKQLAVSILVNASPLPSSSVHHQKVTFGRQVAGNRSFHEIPHRIYGASVAAEILPVSGDLFDKATLRVTDLCQLHITFGCNAAVAFCTISHQNCLLSIQLGHEKL